MADNERWKWEEGLWKWDDELWRWDDNIEEREQKCKVAPPANLYFYPLPRKTPPTKLNRSWNQELEDWEEELRGWEVKLREREKNLKDKNCR